MKFASFFVKLIILAIAVYFVSGAGCKNKEITYEQITFKIKVEKVFWDEPILDKDGDTIIAQEIKPYTWLAKFKGSMIKKKKEKTGKEVPDVKVGPFASVGHAGSGMFTVNVTAMLQVSEPSSSWHTFFAVRILYNPSIITKYGLHVQFKFDKNQYMAWKESGFKDLTAEYEYVQRTGLRSAFSSQEIGGTLKSEDGKITVQGEKYHEKVPSEKWAGR